MVASIYPRCFTKSEWQLSLFKAYFCRRHSENLQNWLTTQGNKYGHDENTWRLYC